MLYKRRRRPTRYAPRRRRRSGGSDALVLLLIPVAFVIYVTLVPLIEKAMIAAATR